jgi:hypothetical protein
MTVTLLIQIGIIPALLVVLAGMLILHVGSNRTAGRRFLLYLLAVGVLLIAAVFVAGQLDNQPAFRVLSLLASVLIGVLALILVNLKLLAQLNRGEKALASLLGLAILALLALTWWRQPSGMASAILLPSALLLAAAWALVGRFEALGVVLSLVCLVLLALFNALPLVAPDLQPPTWLGISFFVSHGLAVALAAALISAGLRLFPQPRNAGQPGAAPSSWFPAVLRLGLAVLLLGCLAYTILWASIWDQTSDGIGGIFLSILAGPVAIAAGMLMGVTATGWRRSAGLAFAVLVPVLMFGAFDYGRDVSYHAITEARAARIQHAVERFHARDGRYPEELRELVPRDLLWIPRPVILQGRGWCYQGGQDHYRLGTFYREYFSTPLSLRIYASAGSAPESVWACEEKMAELKARHDPQPMYEHDTAPTEEPLPTSVVPIPRTPVQPLVRARSITLGSWSLDGKYLVFGSLEATEEPPSTTLNFLNAETGHVCQADERYPAVSSLRRRHAWLPDGRLLFISEGGEMDLLKPCEAGRERLADRYPAKFSQVAAYEGKSGRILLKSEQAYWILDGDSLEARQIPEVSPNPYRAHWDNYAWSPGGERLAISRLNGRDRKAGSTLYLVAGDTGEVVESLPLDYASDQSAPMVEWLTWDELLLHSGGLLEVMDFRSDPPRIIHVLKDIFALDIDYPDEVSSMTWIVHPAEESYHLAVRVNHPRNQDSYLYHSETGSVEVLCHEVDTIFFFPDGEWTELRKMPNVPTYQDEYELVWVDAPGKETRRLVVQGHTPRNYPTLFARYLPRSSQMAFSSSQGISLVSVPDGELLRFWELAGAEGSRSTHVLASPDEKVLVAIADRVGLYFIPLPRRM